MVRSYDGGVSEPPPHDPSLTRMQARPENTRHIRHAALLARWPVLPEQWARKIDEAHGASERPRMPGTSGTR